MTGSLTRVRSWAWLPALVLTAAACGGGGGTSTDSETSSAPTTSSVTVTPSSAESYLPVPTGTDLTAPGSELALGEPATVAWMPRQDLVGVVTVTVQSLAKVKPAAVKKTFAGYDLPADQEPYFVTASVVNAGDTDLGERQIPLYVVDSSQRLVEPSGIAPDFKPCPGSTLPAVFAPAKKASTCLVFLLPPGTQPESITFRPPDGVVPITWTGKTTTYPAARAAKKSKR